MKARNSTFQICCVSMMAAIAFAANYFRIPFLESSVHLGNVICVLCGLLLGPIPGFLAAGIGNFLFDIAYGYGAEALITFLCKGCIALVSALIAKGAFSGEKLSGGGKLRVLIACVAASFTYVALYMLKTFVFGLTVNGLTLEATRIKMLAKLPASLINAVFASIVSPVLTVAMFPPLKHLGLWE